jgi:hypothetical protein
MGCARVKRAVREALLQLRKIRQDAGATKSEAATRTICPELSCKQILVRRSKREDAI